MEGNVRDMLGAPIQVARFSGSDAQMRSDSSIYAWVTGCPKMRKSGWISATTEIRWTLLHTLLKCSVDSPACHENSRQLGSTIASEGFGSGETEAQSPARARS